MQHAAQKSVISLFEAAITADVAQTNASAPTPADADHAPSSLKDFFARFWMRAPAHVRHEPGFFDTRFALTDVEHMWHNIMKWQGAMEGSGARAAAANTILFFSKGRPVEGLRNPFYAYAHGASVVCNRCDRFSPAVRDICREFERHFPFVYCNSYLTPPGTRTVPAHSDDRDVFVLQVLGTKRWKVWGAPPVCLPYKSEEVGKARALGGNDDDRYAQAGHDTTALPVAFEGDLEQGSLLYLPRGFVHEARALSDGPSMHLTIAVQTSDWDATALARDAFAAALEELRSRSRMPHAAAAAITPTDYAAPPKPEMAALIGRTVLSPPVLAAVAGNISCALDTGATTPALGPLMGELDALKPSGAQDVQAPVPSSLYSTDVASDVAALRATIGEAVALALDPHAALRAFQARIHQLHAARDATIAEEVEPLSPPDMFDPLTPRTTLLWNPAVSIQSVQSVREPGQLECAQRLVIFVLSAAAQRAALAKLPAERRAEAQESDPQRYEDRTLFMRVSLPVLAVLQQLERHHRKMPVQVADLQQMMPRSTVLPSAVAAIGDSTTRVSQAPLGLLFYALCVANIFVRNQALIRIS